jgi:DNA processing protein
MDAARVIEDTCARLQVNYIFPGEPLYPASLFDLAEPPLVLYYRGDPALLGQPGVTIVGTRRATQQGLAMAEHIADLAVRAGYGVISGGAEGIDTAAHTGALAAQGKTIAVLGGGLLGIMAPAREELFDRILRAGGLLVSEYPPRVPAHPFYFVRRNRILAALACHIYVVQAPKNSGTMITLDWARTLGRGITCCLWPPELREAEGCRIFHDARILHTADGTGFLQQEVRYRTLPEILNEVYAGSTDSFSEPQVDERNILFALIGCGRRVPDLVRASALSPQRALSALTRLELQNRVRQAGGRVYAACAKKYS